MNEMYNMEAPMTPYRMMPIPISMPNVPNMNMPMPIMPATMSVPMNMPAAQSMHMQMMHMHMMMMYMTMQMTTMQMNDKMDKTPK